MRTKLVLLVLLLACLLSSSLTAGEAPRTRLWHADMTAVVLLDAQALTRADVVAEITTLGGMVVLESDGVLICRMSDGAARTLAAHPKVRNAAKTPLDLDELQLASGDAAHAIGYFNWVASGEAAADLDRPREDAEFHDRVIHPEGLTPRSDPAGANGLRLTTHGTRDQFSGTIQVNLFLVQSTGLSSTPGHTWSAAERTDAYNRVADAMAWWRARYDSQFIDTLSFRITRNDVTQSAVEMALSDTAGHDRALAQIMTGLCGTMTNCPWRADAVPDRAHIAVEKYNEFTQGGATSVFSVFLAYNPRGSGGVFGGGEAGYWSGPDWIAPYRPNGAETNLNFVAAHETGHVFGACDEYAGSCTDCGPCGRRNMPNGNCFGAPSGASSCYLPGHDRRKCIMTNDYGAYDAPTDELTKACAFTRLQIGWWPQESCFKDVPWDLGDDTRWQGEYFDHLSPGRDEVAQLIRDDGPGFLDESFGTSAPSGSCMTRADGFAVRWKRKVKFDAAGTYTFTVTTDEGFELYVDGALVAKQTTAAADAKFDFGVSAGSHEVRLEYFDTAGDARAKLSWALKSSTNCGITASVTSDLNACPNGAGRLSISVRGGTGPWKVSLRVNQTGQILGFDIPLQFPGGADARVTVPVGAAGIYTYSIVNVTDSNNCPGTGSGTGTIVASTAPRWTGFATATVDRDACAIVVEWPAAESCEPGGSVVYSVQRNGQAIPEARCLTATKYVDHGLGTGQGAVYTVVAESGSSGASGPCRGGSVSSVSTNFRTLTGCKKRPSLTIENYVVSVNVSSNQPLNVSALLTVDGQPMAGATVRLTLFGVAVDEITDAQGRVRLNQVIREKPGSYPGALTASFAGNAELAAVSSSLGVNVLCDLNAFLLSPDTLTLKGPNGGDFKINVSTFECDWTPVPDPEFPWLTVSGKQTNPDKSGSFVLHVAPITAGARTGTVSVNGRRVTVEQSVGCTYRFSPDAASLPSSGPVLDPPAKSYTPVTSVDILAPGDCAWTIRSNAAWLHLVKRGTSTPDDPNDDEWEDVTQLSGSGNAKVTFRAENNTTRNGRLGKLQVVGSTDDDVKVNQAGPPVCRSPQLVLDAGPDTSVEEGQNIVVAMSATGTDLRYRWTVSGESNGIFASSRIIIPKTHSWYPTASEGSKLYRVVASNDCGSVTVSKRVTVIPASKTCTLPFITDHPDNQSSPFGGARVDLGVSASGNGPLTIRWYYGPAGDDSTFVGSGASVPVYPSQTSFYWAAVTDSCGTQISGSATVVITNPARRRSSTFDFNSDGQSDLLWQRRSNKEGLFWTMFRNLKTGSRGLPAHSDPNAEVQGIGDFNGDSRPDLIWRNPVSGANSIWPMNGLSPAPEVPLEARPDTRWIIGGTGDFDGDEHHDIVWHNSVTGENEIWFQEDNQRVGSWALPDAPSPDWQLHGAGDFNQDGRPDLFFHDHRTGGNSIWTMTDDSREASRLRSSTMSASRSSLPIVANMEQQTIEGMPDTNFVPVQVADMDNDDRPDIVWRHKTSGDIVVWRIVGGLKVSTTTIDKTGVESPDWQLGGPGNGTPGSGATTPQPGTTPASISASATNASYGGATVITAALTSNGTPVAGAALEFLVNGAFVAEVLTNASGTAVVAAGVEGLAPGSHPNAITVRFNGDSTYAATSASADLVVGAPQPVITWNNPAPITYGTPLGAAQLDAAANIAGTFVYSPAAGAILPTGYQRLSVTFTPADPAYLTVTQTALLLVNRGSAQLAWNAPAPVTYGTRLSSMQLNATSAVAGSFTYDPADGTLLDVGNAQMLRATFTPDDEESYAPSTITTTIDVLRGQQTVVWTPPQFLFYGEPLTGSTLIAAVQTSGPAPAGALTFNPPAGTILEAGTHTLTATAAATAQYESASASAQIAVLAATPSITWSSPAAIVYGTPLSSTQLNATASVAGTFTYAPAAGTVLPAGTAQTLSVQFTPSDTRNYRAVSASVTVDVLKAKPVITWPQPQAVVYGTPLSGTQLNATASVAGTFVYAPAAGTRLDAGAAQTLTVQFTPADAQNYETATAGVTIDVAKAKQTIVWSSPASIVYGTTLGAAQLNAQVQVVGPAAAGALTYAPPAGTLLQAGGAQTLRVTVAETANYEAATASVTIDVLKAKPVITWPQPAPIVYRTPLGPAQLNATANVAGSFAYTPAAGTVLEAGAQTLSAHFTPSDAHNYETAGASVTLEVQQATPVITWPQPASIVYGTPLGAAQLNATADVPGTFTYTPPAGTILNAGPAQTLSVQFTPSDTRNFKNVSASVTIDVAKAKQHLTWTAPAPIVYGTPLGATQLAAQVAVVGPAPAGTLVYTPPAGTVLDAGSARPLTVVAQETANYESATLPVAIDVTRAPLSLRADAKTKLYGAPVPPLTGTLTGVVNGDPITASYATPATQQSAAGTYPITASLVDPMQRLVNYDVGIVNTTLSVLPAPLSIAANPATKQYSDPLPQLTATFTGFVLGESPAVLGGVLSLQTPAVRLSPPGQYPITIGGLSSPNYAITYAGATLVVTAEDARVSVTSPLLVMTSPATSGNAVVRMAATVKDISATSDANGDTDAGDIRKATLAFVDRASGQTLCSAVIGLLDPGDERAGTATCTFTTDIGSAASATRDVGVKIGGYYTRDAAADDVAVTIARPGDDFITGGGAITLAGGAGARAGDAGSAASFAMNLQYQKNSGTVKGAFTLTFTRTESSGPRTYEISTTAVGSLAIRRTSTGGTAAILATAVLRDITIPAAPVVIATGVPLVVTATDGGEPARNLDTLSVSLLDPNGGLWMAAGWNGTRAIELPLREGNLAVHYAR